MSYQNQRRIEPHNVLPLSFIAFSPGGSAHNPFFRVFALQPNYVIAAALGIVVLIPFDC